MNLRTVTFVILALWGAFVVGCTDVESDRPASRPNATGPTTPSPDSIEPDTEPDADPETDPDSPPPDTPETVTDVQPEPPEEVVVDLDAVLDEIAALEQDAKYFEAFTRVRDLSKTYRDRPEGAELIALQQRLYKCHRRSSGLDYAIRQLGSDSEVAVSVATGKLFEAGDVGLVFLRKAVRQAEPKIAAGAANILIEQSEPQIIRLMVERMEQDPPEPLGDDLGRLLQRLDTIESEWIDRLCALARREGSSQSGAVGVLIDRLERSILAQLETADPENGEGDAAKKDKPEPPESVAIEVDPRLVHTLYEVAQTAEGSLQRQVVDALLTLVLEHVNRRDGKAFNQLLANDQAYGSLGDYVVANLKGEQLEDRLWAIPRAELLQMQAPGFWASVQLEDDPTVLHERIDPTLSFGDVNALRETGPVEQGHTVRWTGFVNVPADGDYTFSVDCAETSPTTLFVDGEQTTAEKDVELSAGWHEMRAEMSLSGDLALVQVAWEGPDLGKQSIPVERVACADRTRMLIWQLGRKCDLTKARSLTEQLLPSLERVDKDLAEKLMTLTQVDGPSRPAIAAALGELLDYSMAHASEAPEWESQALPLLLGASDEISGPEQRRVVASLVNHLARRAGSQKDDFNTQAESPDAYGNLRAFIAERLDDQDPEIARWAMQQAGPVQLALQGLWAKTYAQPDPAEGNNLLDERLSGSLNYADSAALQLGLAKRIAWEGYLDVPVQGAYTFTVDSGEQIAIQLDGEAVEPGKPVEFAAGLHPMIVEFRLKGAEPKLIVSWQPPDKTEPEVIPSDRLTCPDWPKVLTWGITQEPQQAEAIAERLGLMINRIDQPMAEELLALVTPDGPSALPAAEVLSRLLSAGHLDDTFEKTWPEHLWPLVKKADGQRQQMLVGGLVTVLEKLFEKNGPEFEKAVKVDDAFLTLRDFVAVRLDAEETNVAAWAMDHTGPFGLSITGLWTERLASPDGPPASELSHSVELNLGDLNAVTGAGRAKQGEAIRWTGYLKCPSDGPYVFTIDAAAKSPVVMKVAGQVIEFGKPIELPAGTHAMDVTIEIGPDAKLVLNWQQPGGTQPALISRNAFICPAWPKLLVWQLHQDPELEQAEEICTHLARMIDQIDQSLVELQLPLIKPDAPLALPVAELLARILPSDHLDDTFEKTLPEQLWPFVEQAEGQRQRVLVGALVWTLTKFFGNKETDFDAAVKVDGAFRVLRDIIAAQLDDKEPNVAAWAVDHAGPFGLAHSGMWLTRLSSPNGPSVREQHYGAELNHADLAAVLAATGATKGQTIHWTGQLRCPSDGPYVFTIGAGAGSPVAMKVAGQAIESGKPTELTAGLQEAEITLTIGPDAKFVVQWQAPGSTAAAVLHSNSFVCPAWAQLLVWQLQQGPELEQAEKLASRLALMTDRVDQSLAEQLLPLIKPDSPIAQPVAEVLARVLRRGHLDDTYEKTLPELLWLFVEKTTDERQRVVVGALIDALDRLFENNAVEFEKVNKADGAFLTLCDFVAARLDAEETDVAAWAVDHTEPFGLGLAGLWLERIALPGSPPVTERHHGDELNLADLAAVTGAGKARQGEMIRWTGYLRCPTEGAYVLTVDTGRGSLVEMKILDQAVQFGKPMELPVGVHAIDLQLKIGPDAKLVVNWQQPGSTQAGLISRNSFACPAWAKVLVWQLQQEPNAAQAEEICTRLARMVDRIDQTLAEQLLALVEPDGPIALPVADVLARVLRHGHLDDTFEKSLPAHLWPLVEKADEQRERVLVGSLVTTLAKLFANNAAEFDKAVKVPDVSRQLQDYVTERLDANELSVRLWAAEHAEPFTLLGSGLEGSYFDAGFKTREFDRVDTKMQFEPGQFGYPDKRNDNMGIRWSGLIAIPADGDYIFSCVADDTCRLRLDGTPVIQDARKPATANMTAGLHEIQVEFVENSGAERLVVYWQPPGQGQPKVLESELKHVDLVQLLLYKLTHRPDDPQAVAWLQELAYKADRLAPEPIENLAELSQNRTSWQSPLSNVLAAAILRDPAKVPVQAASLLSKSVVALQGTTRRQAVEALVAYFSTTCGRDKAKFQQAVGSDKTYDLLCDEVRSAAVSTKATDTEWAQQQADILELKLDSPDE